MVAAIGGSTPAAATPVQGTGSGGLDAQLARYEKQLSECINCASASTPEGKQQIDDLYGKIHDIKARIEARADTPVQPADSVPRTVSPYATTGSVIDVYA